MFTEIESIIRKGILGAHESNIQINNVAHVTDETMVITYVMSRMVVGMAKVEIRVCCVCNNRIQWDNIAA